MGESKEKAAPSVDSSTAQTKPSTSPKDKEPKTLKWFWKNRWSYAGRFQPILPHLVPPATTDTYIRYASVAACSLAERVLHVLVPIQLGRIVSVLETPATHSLLLKNVAMFILLKFLGSGSGISMIESSMWRPIETSATARLNLASYRHLMSLSSDFHDNKKTAEVLEGVRAGHSVIRLIAMLSFDLVPRLLDLVLALGILWTKYDANTASIAIATMMAYNYITIRNRSKRKNRIRKQVDVRGQTANVLVESATNWYTVAYFNRFNYETKRYEESIRENQKVQEEARSTSMGWGAAQQAVTLIGLGSAYFSIATQVRSGQKTAADFIVFTTYWSQLIGPMSSFIHLFMFISQTLIETEKIIDLFETKPTVKEVKDANDLKVTIGAIEFKDVTFGYNKNREILKGVSFQCVPGSTTAIVGETGGGKSTMLKLMARFYDTTTGTITIDNQDIKNVTLDSLRSIFGHVPQSVGVFNTTILENLRYGKLDATLEECQEACRAAALHDRITTFPDGYETIVGEKGVKLSGGELQRLAIARVVLKNPQILLLDEATSSVDTGTEALIQESLHKVAKGRTTIVVAHRLSTISHAESILVVKDGQVVESGNHEELLGMQGVYYGLWTKQKIKPSPPADLNGVSKQTVLQRTKSCPSLQMK